MKLVGPASSREGLLNRGKIIRGESVSGRTEHFVTNDEHEDGSGQNYHI